MKEDINLLKDPASGFTNCLPEHRVLEMTLQTFWKVWYLFFLSFPDLFDACQALIIRHDVYI